MSMNNLYQTARNWIYRNARPLDLARWQYHFEHGAKEKVIQCLSEYQNEDGGFGHALEADAWNPNSSPIQTFQAIEILNEIGFTEKNHPLIQGILRYLDSEKDFEDGSWLGNVESNNAYPHAPWWHMDSVSASHDRYNPTAGLIGFALYYSDRNSKLYEKCAVLAAEATAYLASIKEVDQHVLICFITLWEYCKKANINNLFSLAELEKNLIELIHQTITQDTGIWATSYCCKPSQFIRNKESVFYSDNAAVAAYECDFIINNRNNEGIWDVTWGWEEYPEEWAISKNWWKATIVIKNIRYLYGFGRNN